MTEPAPTRPPLTRPPRGTAAATVVAVLVALVAALALVVPTGAAGAQSDPTAPVTTAAPVITPDGCGPGNIIQLPDCGTEPTDAGDPGGSLQVALFFMVCAVVLVMAGGLVWRSKLLRQRRAAAGVDPAEIARRRDEAFRSGS